MKEDLKNIILMGLGVMSLTNEKAQDLKKELLEKGFFRKFSGKWITSGMKYSYFLFECFFDIITIIGVDCS